MGHRNSSSEVVIPLVIILKSGSIFQAQQLHHWHTTAPTAACVQRVCAQQCAQRQQCLQQIVLSEFFSTTLRLYSASVMSNTPARHRLGAKAAASPHPPPLVVQHHPPSRYLPRTKFPPKTRNKTRAPVCRITPDSVALLFPLQAGGTERVHDACAHGVFVSLAQGFVTGHR